MSIVKRPRIADYWAENVTLGNERIKSMLAKNRFLKIKHYFHISDRESELMKNENGFNFSQKVEPLQTYLRGKFMTHFKTTAEVSVDEALVKFKCRLGIIQYMPLKLAKRGIKIWMLCTPYLGYTLNFELYCGKSGSTPRTKNGLGYDVVMHLAKGLESKNHTCFDRFFSSVNILLDLYKVGIFACGTVMSNRKNLPPGMKILKLKEIIAISTLQCKDIPNLLSTTWLDMKQISIISTNAKNEICQAHRRKGAEKLLVQCSAVFAQYNRHTHWQITLGVDLADQRRKYFSVARKSSKWWWYIFSFLLDTALSNAFILMKATNSPPPKLKYQLYDFKLELNEELGKEGCRKRANSDFTPT
ncbi:PiggyBac transposable element-derived protein 4 [Araneus ventricosus]|uniref:PiggyBac transposable element-derived protein 4 n=1 Tax=Araneus ventricosus TaxID=182803 RepID=A0A4Y2A2A8_ARAVE|nr:PiggyBac transposable element-derived protein 4 [Araneus ventricosus]